ncbi:pyridoxal phosphate-dependent aminotransferase [Prochlorococcus sp. MIT 1307]|uniref:pyridoxal phosphate-dependent aminotransferase n=1 Tax=Prochlorococcus sp. MIT 1307 TaxID=3096219 RepID=UPI002A7535F2|nr:pyridoxal phosphate-dependent aminotransferase [Prochlorococcus sp. MIT 1307]
MPHPPLISQRAVALQPSLTLAISAKAKALKQEGKDICSLSAGEPNFDTPEFITEAAVQALRDGITRYGPAAGDPELREAVASKLSETNQIPTRPENVLITNGGKQAIYNLFQVILNPGDEVIIPAPYWLSYPEITLLAGAIPKTLSSSPDDGFCLDLEKLERMINNKTRLLILNSPGNPTGRVMPLVEMKQLAEILRRHPQVLVMSDEIYEFLLSDGEVHYSFAATAPDLVNRIFTVNGFAKGWAMTGWRLGYLSGNLEVIKAASALQSQSTSNVCSFAQRGALAALTGPRDCVFAMAKKYNSRREILFNGLNTIKGLSLVSPKGAFYAFPQLPAGSPKSINFCELALEKVGLAIVPGAAFGNDNCVRLSCAVRSGVISEGLKRLDQLISQL